MSRCHECHHCIRVNKGAQCDDGWMYEETYLLCTHGPPIYVKGKPYGQLPRVHQDMKCGQWKEKY